MAKQFNYKCGAGPEIVLLEDDAMLQEILTRCIRGVFAEVDLTVFQDGNEAWERLSSSPPHLFVTDEIHPGMSGNEIVDGLINAKARVAVLWTSWESEMSPQISNYDSELRIEILEKPFSVEQFREKLKSMAESFPG